VLALLPLALLGAGCEGSGSDLGPRIESRDDVDFKVTVRDDAGRAVVGALVTATGSSSPSPTLRTGRAEFLEIPSGVAPRFSIDGSAAAAVTGDRLSTLHVAVSAGAVEVPFVIYLPDTAPSAGLALNAGTQVATATLDDSGTSGAVLTVPSGISLGLGGASAGTLRTGVLQADHLPPMSVGPQPVASGAILSTRGVQIEPAEATFSPGIDLDLPNDIGLGAAATATLYHLDPDQGVWLAVGVGTVDGSGARVRAAGAVTRGGLYAFAEVVGTTATIEGRIRTKRLNQVVDGVLVRADHAVARTRGDGSFTLENVPALDGAGNARATDVVFTGGRRWWPITGSANLNLVAGANQLPEQQLETMRVGSVRALMVTRGVADPYRRLGISHNEGTRAVRTRVDGEGRVELFDIEQGTSGFLTSKPYTRSQALVTEGLAFLPFGRSHTDLLLFANDLNWIDRSRSSRLSVVDEVGGGGIFFAEVFQGLGNDFVRVGNTRIDGSIVTDKNARSAAYAVVATERDGRGVTSGIMILDPIAARIEMPLERATRDPLGAFEPFGLVSGTVTSSAGAGRVRRIRTTPVINLLDWYDGVFFDRDISELPVDVDPSVTMGVAFSAGCATPRGHLTVAEGTVAGGVFTLERVGGRLALAPQAGREVLLDLDLSLPASTSFRATAGARNLDPALQSSLTFDLGAQRSDGSVVDIVRDVGGNIQLVDGDLLVDLPDPSGVFEGASWLLGFDASATNGGVTTRQQSFARFDGVTAIDHPGFLAAPQILTPAPGATVDADRLAVSWTVPDGANYVEVELRSDLNNDLRVWKALVPTTRTSVEFRDLDPTSVDPFIPGRTYTLTVRASRYTGGVLTQVFEPYSSVVAHYYGVHPADRAIDGISTQTITIDT